MDEQNGSASEALDYIVLQKASNCTNPSRKFRYLGLFIFIILSLCTRFYGISRGPTVIWDEAHFGKFGSYYLNHTFYTDVHPPLGKMLVGLAGYLSNYNGSYTFPSGEMYPPHINYTLMRIYVATLGALSVPLVFLTCLNLEMDKWTSVFVTFCLLFDNGLIGISRLILLDSILLFFTSLSVFALSVYLKNRDKPFSRDWWSSLIFTGVSIGLVSSVKWVGFFVTALVGYHAIHELWTFYGDFRISKPRILLHFFARVLCLIIVPVLVYMASFYVHFSLLYKTGPGDAQMSSRFQAHLRGNDISKSSITIAYGSKVTLRNNVKGGGLLHSHQLLYPVGSGLQQVTAYHHKDDNNQWIVEKPHQLSSSSLNLDSDKKEVPGILSDTEDHDDNKVNLVGKTSTDQPELLKSGDVIRLVHLATDRNLHCHFGSFAYLIKTDLEVSGYGNNSQLPDPNNHWIIEIVRSAEKKNTPSFIRNIKTLVRFKHAVTGCYLASTKGPLPEWASNQQEVSCELPGKSSNGMPLSKNTIWNFETNYHSQLPKGSASLYQSDFLDDFVELNLNMWHMNNALTKDEEIEPSPLTSNPLQWPFLTTGIRMTSFDDGVVKFYMLGNPIVWWLGAVSVVGLILLILARILLTARATQCNVEPEKQKNKVLNNLILEDSFWMKSRVALLGWFLHFFPFLLMGRVLYLHHYYPALIFSVMCTGILIDSINSAPMRKNVICVLTGIVTMTFLKFAPICYGMQGPIDEYYSLRWLNSWNL